MTNTVGTGRVGHGKGDISPEANDAAWRAQGIALREFTDSLNASFEPLESSGDRPVYGYYIDLDERGEFRASVRDVTGDSVYEIVIDGEDYDIGNIFTMGFMKGKNDLNGLQTYISWMDIIPSDSRILGFHEFEQYVDKLDAQQMSDATARGIGKVPIVDSKQIEDIEKRILSVIPTATNARSLGSGAPGLAVRRGAILPSEATLYSQFRGFVGVERPVSDQYRLVSSVAVENGEGGAAVAQEHKAVQASVAGIPKPTPLIREFVIGAKIEFNTGDAVICNGFQGTVSEVLTGQLAGMVNVRVPGGLTCVSSSYPDCFPATVGAVEIATEGRYSGAIKDVTDQFVIQDVGRGKLVGHQRAKFDTLPVVGQYVDLIHRQNSIEVSVKKEKSVGVGR